MSDDEPFADLVRRVRGGEPAAVEALVRGYEPVVRTYVRARLADELRPRFGASDVCQSVFVSFFLRAMTGQFVLHEPAQLRALLRRMTHNKLVSRVRKERRERRDHRRAVGLDGRDVVPDARPGPPEQAQWRELVERLPTIWQRLTPTEREVAGLRIEGLSWPAVAERTGRTAEGCRKCLDRAEDRILRELGLADDDDDCGGGGGESASGSGGRGVTHPDNRGDTDE